MADDGWLHRDASSPLMAVAQAAIIPGNDLVTSGGGAAHKPASITAAIRGLGLDRLPGAPASAAGYLVDAVRSRDRASGP